MKPAFFLTKLFLTGGILSVGLMLTAVSSPAQTAPPKPAAKPVAKAPAKIWAPPRTAEGVPDLSGLWTNVTVTPLERPAALGTKAFFTPEEAAAYEKRFNEENNRDKRDDTRGEADLARAYNEAWWDRGSKVVGTRRTSLIVDPTDGRIPALTPAAQKAVRERGERLRQPPNGPEDRGIQERCIVGVNVGPPMLPTVYNNNFQIFQSKGYVVIFSEMIHDFRIIRTDGSPHLPPNFRFWSGDSRGHWEGDTLVVDTTNFNGKVRFRGSDENLHVIERITRIGPGELLYRFEMDNPTAFTKPWAGEVPMTTLKEPIFEYACHEGNRGLEGLMSAARADERKAAEEAAKKK